MSYIMQLIIANVFVAILMVVVNFIAVSAIVNKSPEWDKSLSVIESEASARILSIQQTTTFYNNNPVIKFSLEVTQGERNYFVKNHNETILLIALNHYKVNDVYRVKIGVKDSDVAFIKDSCGFPIIVNR